MSGKVIGVLGARELTALNSLDLSAHDIYQAMSLVFKRFL